MIEMTCNIRSATRAAAKAIFTVRMCAKHKPYDSFVKKMQTQLNKEQHGVCPQRISWPPWIHQGLQSLHIIKLRRNISACIKIGLDEHMAL